MTRFRILLGLAVAVGLFMPTAANASVSVPKPNRAVAAAQAGARPVTRAECSTLRRYTHRPQANCANMKVIHVPGTGAAGNSRREAPASEIVWRGARPSISDAKSYYWGGWELFCYDNLCTNKWGTMQSFQVTFIHGVGVWNNWHQCADDLNFGTSVTWCGLWHNGWSNYMEEGENFTQGYMREEIDTYGNITSVGAATTGGYLYGCLGEPGAC